MSSDSLSRPPVPDMLRVFGWAERFELLDCIGSGAMGQVWRARENRSRGHKPVADDGSTPAPDHRLAAAATPSSRGHKPVADEVSGIAPDHRLAAAATTERIVALKMLDPARVGDEQTLARLDIEAATLMKLREAGAHANVVPILDFKLTDSHACLVMEFIPGLNLKKWCEAHRLGLRERVHLIAQVARASGWFHALGIVHRDLKPANILVNAVTHQPVIVDFSIAKLDDSLPITLTNEALGTAPYMAPEQIDRRRGGITPATDVYALGATLYELLTQVPPHPGDLTQVVRRHAEEIRPAPPSALNPEVPRDLECIILKALSHRVGDRYADGTALADDLDRFLIGEPVKARPLPLVTRLIRRARQKPALTAALAACVLLGSFAGWNVWRRAVQRQIFSLETQLAASMQLATWTPLELEKAERALTALNGFDPARAADQRRRMHEDISHDIESRLSQNHLHDADFEWLRHTSAWLRPRLPDAASRLESLITQRVGRWETQADLRPPFTDKQRLFPRSNVHVLEGLLHVVHGEPNANPPGIVITDAVSVPMEIDVEFVADPASFHHVALGFLHESAVVEILLYETKHVAQSVRSLIDGGVPAEWQGYILYFQRNGEFQHFLHIPDKRLLENPFRLTLRVERLWAEATLNQLWHLRLDTPFVLGSSQIKNGCRISWPEDIGLRSLSLRTRRPDAVSPIDQADLLAAQGHWPAARRLYENLRGDPQFGSEADCKIAQCLWREGEHAAAQARWEKVVQGPPSVWRERSLLQLSMHCLRQRDWVASARYLDMLPTHLPPSTLGQVDPQLSMDFSALLVNTGLGIARPRIEPDEVRLIAQAFEVIQTPPLVMANRLGMAHHFVRQDLDARRLFDEALNVRHSHAQTSEGLLAATNCLDQWCRLVPSEKDTRLAEALARWRSSINGQAIWQMEQARRAARAGDLRAAIAAVREARQKTPEKLDNRLHTSLWLLEGMLYRLQGAEDRAQNAWKKAGQVAATVTLRHPLHLYDCLLLHSLSRTWDHETTSQVISTLYSRHLDKEDRSGAQAAIDHLFHADPTWLATLNDVLQGKEGRKLAEDHVLCRLPPRELVLRLHRLILEQHFLSTAFPQATAEQSTRVHQIVDTLVTEMAANPRGKIAHLFAYLRAWNDRAAAQTLFHKTYPYSPELIENLKWLLSMRQRQ